jgi:serine/threonine protein kinase
LSEDDSRFDLAADDLGLTRLDAPGGAPPARIGPYRVLQKLGEGGMGVIYEAEQERPVRRRVALKVIKLGMDTAQVIARFESERQALALMNHPNIARVYEAGATEEGRPFFAMEYVRGVPIHDYANRNRLDTRERLELFIQVCEGVQHAHQKGIIHRDLKPSNVLVTDEDGRRVPKIIDFGVAKATASQRLTEKTLFTEMGQLIGTPEYMSPEQAEMTGVDIDTRTDVYLLGVLLYELLTGELPFDTGELRRVGFDEFRRKVLEEDPPRPSTRFTRADEPTQRRAAERRVDLPALSRQLRGDLDWITMKALEKDRARRYASASELAADVRRFLQHEPVLASPPGNLYRLRKFARRHKAGASFGAVLLVLLTGFAVAMTIQNQRLARLAHEKEREAAAAQRVAQFLEQMFKTPDPNEARDTSDARGNRITAREILDRGAQDIRTGELREEPSVQARMMRVIGTVYGSLGLPEESRGLLEEALRIQRRVLPPQDLEFAETLESLAGIVAVPFSDYALADRHYREALAIREKHLGPHSPSVAANLNAHGNLFQMQGEYGAALEKYDRVFGILESSHDPDDELMAKLLNNRGRLVALTTGDFERARPMLERALEIVRGAPAAGRNRELQATIEHNLGSVLEQQRDHAGARRHHQAGLELRRAMFADEPHQRVGESLLALARVSLREGDAAQADRLHAEALEIFDASRSGRDDPSVLYDLACFAALRGQTGEALHLLRRAAVEKASFSADVLERNPDLAALRDEVEFRSILAEVRARRPRS